MTDVILKGDKLTLMVGPEGGSSEVELGVASNKGYIPVNLGPEY